MATVRHLERATATLPKTLADASRLPPPHPTHNEGWPPWRSRSRCRALRSAPRDAGTRPLGGGGGGPAVVSRERRQAHRLLAVWFRGSARLRHSTLRDLPYARFLYMARPRPHATRSAAWGRRRRIPPRSPGHRSASTPLAEGWAAATVMHRAAAQARNRATVRAIPTPPSPPPRRGGCRSPGKKNLTSSCSSGAAVRFCVHTISQSRVWLLH